MKKKINFNLCKIFAVCIMASLYSCSDDDSSDNPPGNPTDNDPATVVEGTVSATVDGADVEYPEVRVVVYGLSNTAGFKALDTVPENRTNVINLTVPLVPQTGSFDHNDAGFNLIYEVITGSSESGYYFNRDRETEINVLSYDAVKVSGDTTWYKVEGNFELFGKRQMSSDSVTVENGVFDFTYRYWN